MAQQIINVGTTANDGTGDLLRNGFIKVNQNFTELYTNRISGSGTDNYIPRFNGTNALENSIIFDNGTNIGIGTTSPSVELALFNSSTPRFHLQNSTSGTGSTSGFQIALSSTDSYLWNFQNGANIFGTNNSEKMRITSGGNVGIGTTSPSEQLTISSGNIEGFDNVNLSALNSTTNGTVVNINSKGTVGIIKMTTNGGERMRITSGGNVGIGTTNPTEKLHVAGVAQILDDGTRGRITFQISSAQNDLYSTTTGFDAYRNLKLISNELILSSGGTTERMRITSGGNVGIGTSSPTAAKFVLNSGTTNQNALINGDKIGFTRTSDSAEVVYFKKDTSLGAEGTANINGYDGIQFRTQGAESVKAIITSSGNVGIGTASPAGKLSLYDTTDVWLNVTRNSSFVNIGVDSTGTFYNTNSNHRFVYNSGSNEAMRITSGGELCVGTTTAVGAGLVNIKGAANTFNLLAIQNTFSGGGNFAVFLNPSGGQTGAITMLTTTSTLYATTSDYRLKQDFKNFNGLELLSKIKVYDYEWKSNKSRMNGVIAHELQEVVPYAVTGEKDGEQMQQVDYSKLVPILVQAIQEQQKQIKELQTLIN